VNAGLDLGLTAVGHLDLIAVGLDLVNGCRVVDLVAVGPDLVPVSAGLVLELMFLISCSRS